MSILRPQYQAAYGLWKVLFDRVEFTNYFRQVLQESRTSWLLLKSGGSHFPGDERYRTIRLLDTFFSDTIEPAVLDELVDGALQYGYSIKLLMLDPVGRAARSRAHALGVNAIRETNRGLAQLRSAMRRTEQRGKRGVVDLLERSRQDSLEYMSDQLQDLRDAEDKFRIEVRFYNVLTEAPVYVVHQCAFKGNIKHGVSAVDNPWLVFVDDPHQSDDLYDFFVSNFDVIWDDASTLYPGVAESDSSKSTCFAIVPFADSFSGIWESVQEISDEFSLVPVRGDSDPTGEIFARFRDGIREAMLVISDVSGARANVMFETGMSCEMEKPMILISRDKLDTLPRDISNLQVIPYSTEGEGWRRKLNLKLIETVSGMRDIALRRLRVAMSEARDLQFTVHFKAHKEVTTCSEAAAGRKIALEDEMKTLIIRAKGRDIAIHLRGDLRASPRKVKDAAGVADFTPLDRDSLADKYFAEPGTVCPFTKRVWQLEHIIDSRLERKGVMFTNNGSKTGYVRFSPQILKRAARCRVADLAEEPASFAPRNAIDVVGH